MSAGTLGTKKLDFLTIFFEIFSSIRPWDPFWCIWGLLCIVDIAVGDSKGSFSGIQTPLIYFLVNLGNLENIYIYIYIYIYIFEKSSPIGL